MDSNLIFITVFNYGGIELALNHYKTLTNQGITNYMAFVTDEESLRVMREHGYNVSLIENQGIDKNQMDFCKGDFNKLSFLRYVISAQLMSQGNDVWYMDIDTVVLKDVCKIYELYKQTGSDIILQNDINMACSGCILFIASPDTIKIANFVIQIKDNFLNDQYSLNHILRIIPELYKKQVLSKVLKIDLFSTQQFPNGLLYFLDEDLVQVPPQYVETKKTFQTSPPDLYFVHANWMLGIETKINAFKKMGLWTIV